MSSSIPRGLLMYKQVLPRGRGWRTSYGKRDIRSIKNSGREEIMEKIWGTPRKRERDVRPGVGKEESNEVLIYAVCQKK